MSSKPKDAPGEDTDKDLNAESTVPHGKFEEEHQQSPTVETGASGKEVEKLAEEVAVLREQVLRSQAEAQNTRRRAEQDIEKARKFALEKFVSDLLPVADNLERAVAAVNIEDDAHKAILEGVQLTHKSLLDTLKKFKVEVVDPEGEPFDPQLHQAMSTVPNPDVEPNTVINVFQKGYTLHGRLVRPAMVVVSSAPTA